MEKNQLAIRREECYRERMHARLQISLAERRRRKEEEDEEAVGEGKRSEACGGGATRAV